jgi:MFS family permease
LSCQVELKFDWDAATKGLILSSFFYGYVCTQLPGGWLANRWHGHALFGGGIAATAILTILTPPIAIKGGTAGIVTLRILEGLFEVRSKAIYLCKRNQTQSRVKRLARRCPFSFNFFAFFPLGVHRRDNHNVITRLLQFSNVVPRWFSLWCKYSVRMQCSYLRRILM